MGHQKWRASAIGILFWMIILMSGCGVVQHMEGQEDANAPKDGLLQSEKIQTTPGLSVVYTSNKIRHINEMPGSDWMMKNGSHGEPIPMIAHQFGSGEVFDSGKKREVCVQMKGYLGFNETGSYLIKANSNDGVRVFLDNKMILDDPDVHSDRFTPEVKIEIKKPGRYPILVRYFQRKGSATLEMHWKTPGSDTFDFIPASAYSHDNNVP
jgi:PA14 domain